MIISIEFQMSKTALINCWVTNIIAFGIRSLLKFMFEPYFMVSRYIDHKSKMLALTAEY